MGSQILRCWWEFTVQPRVNRRTSIAAGIVLTLVAVLLMGQYLPLGEVLDQMSTADPVLVGAAALVYLLSWPLRGTRYRDILEELDYTEDAGFLTGAIFISQTGNLVFPARAGDAVRAYVVKARRSIPYPTGFASLAVERVFDLLTITVVAGVVLLGLALTGVTSIAGLQSTVFGSGAGPGNYGDAGQTAVYVAGGVGLAAILAVAVIVLSARSDRNFVREAISKLSNDSYADYVAGVVEQFTGDVQTVAGSRSSFLTVGGSSIAIWTLDVVTALLVLAAFPSVSLPLVTLVAVCFFAVSVGNLAKVLPLSPGGVGLYEGAFTLLVVGLTPLGWSVALGAAILDHAVKNIVTLAGGVVSMLWLNVSLTTAVEESKDARTAADPAEPTDD
jgi:uncharacterized membrane protein YbhN (UPF0104 family)